MIRISGLYHPRTEPVAGFPQDRRRCPENCRIPASHNLRPLFFHFGHQGSRSRSRGNKSCRSRFSQDQSLSCYYLNKLLSMESLSIPDWRPGPDLMADASWRLQPLADTITASESAAVNFFPCPRRRRGRVFVLRYTGINERAGSGRVFGFVFCNLKEKGLEAPFHSEYISPSGCFALIGKRGAETTDFA